MDSLIPISKINDFIFCPYSLYFHTVYEDFSEKVYHAAAQTAGKIKHESIDHKKYSTAKKYWQGAEVCSEKYGLVGKIDIYDLEKQELTERKNKIVKVYDGYRYQLWAQKFCLEEMGYSIKTMKLYSISDNKSYSISAPDSDAIEKFLELLNTIRLFDISKYKITKIPNKCQNCIYHQLCV